jgi:hypothetical protein
MNAIHHTKLYLHQIYNIVSQGSDQKRQIMSQGSMNVMNTITGIQFIGKGKIMLLFSIHGNLRDIMKTLTTEEKD